MKYDLICPIGQCCAVALYLEEFGLRKISLPFDWMSGDALTLQDYVKIVSDRFSSFMRPENLEKIGEEGEYALYRDSGSRFVSMHDFKRALSFDIASPLVSEKFRRRIDRMYRKIGFSKDVLFVHLARTYSPSPQMMGGALAELHRIFPHQNIRLLVLVHSDTTVMTSETLGDEINVICGRFWDPTVSLRFGNKPLGERVFSQLRIRGRLWNMLSLKCVKIWERIRTMFHITSEGRRQARQRLFDASTLGGE